MFWGNNAKSARHEVDSVEPKLERRCGILEDGTDHRVFPVAAELARVRGPRRVPMVLRNPLARRAVDAVRVELLNQSVQTSSIVRVLAIKLKEGERRVGSR